MSRIFRDEVYVPKAKDARASHKKTIKNVSLNVFVVVMFGVGYWWYRDGSIQFTNWFLDHVKFGGVGISDVPKHL